MDLLLEEAREQLRDELAIVALALDAHLHRLAHEQVLPVCGDLQLAQPALDLVRVRGRVRVRVRLRLRPRLRLRLRVRVRV